MKMRVLAALIALGAGISLSGCGSFSKALNLEDSRWSEGNYRDQERQLAESLEVPPTLVGPERKGSLLPGVDTGDAGESAALSEHDIPAYRAKGVAVRSTLCERWLQLDGVSADAVWLGVQKFLKTLGYPVKEASRATGIIRTEYVQRKEIVPLVDVSPLTRLFNKWRPEVAEGAMDRFTVHVTVDSATGRAQIRFHHHQVFATDDGDITRYSVRPYDPVKELEMLYQAAVFFGAHAEQALRQVKVSAHRVEIVQGDEIDGLILNAPMSEAWAYLQSMVWRADWHVLSVTPERHSMALSLAEQNEDRGFWSALAFWRHEDLPKRVVLTLQPMKDDPQRTLLQVDAPEGETPLDEKKRLKVFQKLGLLGE